MAFCPLHLLDGLLDNLALWRPLHDSIDLMVCFNCSVCSVFQSLLDGLASVLLFSPCLMALCSICFAVQSRSLPQLLVFAFLIWRPHQQLVLHPFYILRLLVAPWPACICSLDVTSDSTARSLYTPTICRSMSCLCLLFRCDICFDCLLFVRPIYYNCLTEKDEFLLFLVGYQLPATFSIYARSRPTYAALLHIPMRFSGHFRFSNGSGSRWRFYRQTGQKELWRERSGISTAIEFLYSLDDSTIAVKWTGNIPNNFLEKYTIKLFMVQSKSPQIWYQVQARLWEHRGPTQLDRELTPPGGAFLGTAGNKLLEFAVKGSAVGVARSVPTS